MLKSIFIKVIIYLVIVIFIVPVIILVLFVNATRKQSKNNNLVSTPTVLPSQQNAPLPSKEDVVRIFCKLIDEKRISEALYMMDINDDMLKQSWGVYLNHFSSFKLTNIKKSSTDKTGNSFEVDINVILKENLTDSSIPNYGWDNGINKRWISLVEKEPGKYKISGIATGP